MHAQWQLWRNNAAQRHTSEQIREFLATATACTTDWILEAVSRCDRVDAEAPPGSLAIHDVLPPMPMTAGVPQPDVVSAATAVALTIQSARTLWFREEVQRLKGPMARDLRDAINKRARDEGHPEWGYAGVNGYNAVAQRLSRWTRDAKKAKKSEPAPV
jgi:hypothetical protein